MNAIEIFQQPLKCLCHHDLIAPSKLWDHVERHVAGKGPAGRHDFDRAASRAAWHFRFDVSAGNHFERCGCAIELDARCARQIVSQNLDDSPGRTEIRFIHPPLDVVLRAMMPPVVGGLHEGFAPAPANACCLRGRKWNV